MRTVSVTGHGEARVVPDSAVLRVAATHQAPGVAEALAGADGAATEVVTVASEHTTPDRIATTGVHLQVAYDHEGRRDGFRARHSLILRCVDLASAGALLTALTERVGDRLQVDDVSFEVADRGDAEVLAREAAYADAVGRAGRLAALAGAELGAPQTVLEGESFDAPVGRAIKAVVPAAASLHPGETAVTSSLAVTFQLR
jgi:uncharacterized protein